ncbi:MAG: NUDIX domain-containing protein [Pseudomonadota bacterium]
MNGFYQEHSTDNDILEIVDALDNVVGTARRGKIHEKGLLHRAVHVFVFDGKGRVFVQRRSAAKDRFPGVLDSSAAGHVDPGESYEAAAVRELREELGLSLSVSEVLRVEAGPLTDQEHVVLFEAVTHDEPVLNPEEIQSGEFHEPERLSTMMANMPWDFVPAFVHLWEIYREIDGRKVIVGCELDLKPPEVV